MPSSKHFSPHYGGQNNPLPSFLSKDKDAGKSQSLLFISKALRVLENALSYIPLIKVVLKPFSTQFENQKKIEIYVISYVMQ